MAYYTYKPRKIMFLGASGTGKTTLARWIEQEYSIPFIDTTYSSLIPSTKYQTHRGMMEDNVKNIFVNETRLLSLRSKKILEESKNHPFGDYVTDRSFVDNLAYFIYKTSKDIPGCDTESFAMNVATLLKQQCSHIIFIPFTNDMMFHWEMEDNNKRILNKYFQRQISDIMYGCLRLLGLTNKKSLFSILRFAKDIYEELEIDSFIEQRSIKPKPSHTHVCILEDMDLEARKNQIRNFLRVTLK